MSHDGEQPATLLGRLVARRQPAGWIGRIWTVLAWAYAVTGVALHVVIGVFFALGIGVVPWWVVGLMLAQWTALWVPIVRLWRTRPGAIAFLVFLADIVLWLVVGAIADAVGRI